MENRTATGDRKRAPGRRPGTVRRPPCRAGLVGALLLAAAVSGCGSPVPQMVPEVVRVLPHDTTAYTQGLLLHEGRFYESTGRYGHSTLREVDVESGEVLRSLELPEDYFGEGLALVGDRLIQLTWKEGTAFVHDLDTFETVTDVESLETFEYDGEGWGLCHDGESLFMTTGGSFLHRRDPETFRSLEMIQVMHGHRPLRQVNELACVGDYVYANVFTTDRIVKIDKRTGEVVVEYDASGLLPPAERPAGSDAVLNGIAHDPESGTFYLTGKLWPAMFEVRLPSP